MEVRNESCPKHMVVGPCGSTLPDGGYELGAGAPAGMVVNADAVEEVLSSADPVETGIATAVREAEVVARLSAGTPR